MKLYLLPISTRRTLLYCQKFNPATQEKKSLHDKVAAKATKLWADWEKKESGWQKQVVNYGNHALRRIPYEEWGLKSVPSLSAKREQDEVRGNETVQLVFPESAIPTTKATSVLQTLATERGAYHKKMLIWSFVGMPISAPFAIIPIIPNLPFFYLVYRAWSHWRALSGGKHIQFLVANNLLALSPSPSLDSIYERVPPAEATPQTYESGGNDTEKGAPGGSEWVEDEEDTLLLSQEKGRQLVEALDLPELEVEIERAVWQVEKAIAKAKATDKKTATPGMAPDDKTK